MKKKFYGLLAIFLLVLSLGLFTTSYAADPQPWTWDNIVEFSNQIVSATEGYWQIQKDGATLIKNNNQTILNTLSNNGYNVNDYSNFLIRTDSTYLSIYMFNYNSNGSVSAGSNWISISNITGKYISLFRNNLSLTTNKQNVTSISTSNDYDKIFGLQSKTISNYGYWRLENFYNYVPQPILHFTPGNDGIITVGNYSNVNLVYWWPTIYVTWGIISGYNEISPSLLNYALIRVYPNGDEEVVINPFVEPWYLLSLGEYYWESPQRRIYTNSLYKLLIDYDGDVQTFYFYVVPRNSNIATGSTIPFNWNSGDSIYTTQNQTNDLINEATDTSSIDNTKEALLESGELVKRLNYQEYPNHSYEILFALTRNLCDTLYYSGDTYIDVSIGDWYTHRFYASDFYIPVNGLTYWIYMALIFGYCYLLYRQASELIHAIQEGDLYVLELEDADEYFYM